MAVEVFVADEQSAHGVEPLRWLRLAERVLADEGVRGDAEMSILFVDEQAMTDLNLRFNATNAPTDVLAFPIDEEPSEGGRSPDSGGSGPGYVPVDLADLPTLIGDVVICPAIASRNAPEHAGTYDDEIALLVVHGILHLMGLDHDDDSDAEAMEAREQELLARHHRPPSSAGLPAAGQGPPAGPGTAAGPPAAGEGPIAIAGPGPAAGPSPHTRTPTGP